jgi:hypothetical protein
MVFVGTLTSHNSTVFQTFIDNVTNLTYLDCKIGCAFRFVEGGSFNGETVEIGDMLIEVHKKNY